MSIESAKEFLAKMKSDPEFAAKVTRCKNKEERTQFVASEGYHFTGEELKSLRNELTDDELNQVVGGTGEYCAKEWNDFCRIAGEEQYKCKSFCSENMEVKLPEN